MSEWLVWKEGSQKKAVEEAKAKVLLYPKSFFGNALLCGKLWSNTMCFSFNGQHRSRSDYWTCYISDQKIRCTFVARVASGGVWKRNFVNCDTSIKEFLSSALHHRQVFKKIRWRKTVAVNCSSLNCVLQANPIPPELHLLSEAIVLVRITHTTKLHRDRQRKRESSRVS